MEHRLPTGTTSTLAASDFLQRHEVTALQVLSVLRLAMSAVCILGLTMTADRAQGLIQGLALLPQIPVALITLLTVKRSRHPQRLGFMAAAADGLTLVLLPAIFAFTASPLSASSLLKNDIEIFVLGFAIVNSFTLRPAQPILIGFISALSQVGYYFYAEKTFGSIPVTTSWAENITTPRIQMGSYWFNSLVLIPAMCVLIGILIQRERRNILHAARLERDTTTLERYFSPDVAERLRRDPDLYSGLGGQQRSIAVMFIDLRNFTRLSEQLSADETVALLSDYYEHLAKAVFSQGGSIDKFLGDGLMATFGAVGLEDPAATAHHAVQAGLAVRSALAEINDRRRSQGWPELQQGIGVHYGPAVVGNFGTTQRMEFTAVGDTVNVASRTQEMCKEFQVDFLVTRSLAANLKQDAPILRSRGEMQLRGKAAPIEMFEVV